jgi:uncharacterized membrane protein YhiD involved in acid resistance
VVGLRKNILELAPLWGPGAAMVLVSTAYTIATSIYPATKYEFITQDTARIIFWVFIGIGFLGLVALAVSVVLLIKRSLPQNNGTSKPSINTQNTSTQQLPPKATSKELNQELQLLKISLTKTRLSAQRLTKFVKQDKQILDKDVLEAKNNYRDTASSLVNLILACDCNTKQRMQDFLDRLYRGDTIINQCFGKNPSYRDFKSEIIENFESISDDAKYFIVNWKHLRFQLHN